MQAWKQVTVVVCILAAAGCVKQTADVGTEEFSMDRVAKPAPVVVKGLEIAEYREDNPAVVRPVSIDFGFIPADDPNLKTLRETYGLERLFDVPGDELRRLMEIRDWVYHHTPTGEPILRTADPLKIIDSKEGGGYCMHYAAVMVGCLTALGQPARDIGCDTVHEYDQPTRHHGVVEVWSNQYRKWILMDPMFRSHYEIGGVPLSGLEIRDAWYESKGKGIDIVVGRDRVKVVGTRAIMDPYYHESRTFSLFFYTSHNRFFGSGYDLFKKLPVDFRNVTYIDDHVRGKTFYQGQPTKRESQRLKHYGYSDNIFLFTGDRRDFDWTCNIVHVDLAPSEKDRVVEVKLDTLTPWFDSYRVSIDGGKWKRSGESFTWELKPGVNLLKVRPMNDFGRPGVTSSIEIECRQA